MYKVKYCAYVFVFCVSSGKFNLSFGGGILINLIDGWYIDADSNCYAVHKIIPADEKSISPSGKGDPEKIQILFMVILQVCKAWLVA